MVILLCLWQCCNLYWLNLRTLGLTRDDIYQIKLLVISTRFHQVAYFSILEQNHGISNLKHECGFNDRGYIYIRMALIFFIGYIYQDGFDVFLWGYRYQILVAHCVYILEQSHGYRAKFMSRFYFSFRTYIKS